MKRTLIALLVLSLFTPVAWGETQKELLTSVTTFHKPTPTPNYPGKQKHRCSDDFSLTPKTKNAVIVFELEPPNPNIRFDINRQVAWRDPILARNLNSDSKVPFDQLDKIGFPPRGASPTGWASGIYFSDVKNATQTFIIKISAEPAP